jgi:hypothetical protein
MRTDDYFLFADQPARMEIDTWGPLTRAARAVHEQDNGLSHLLKVAWLPTSAESRLGRAVEPEDGKVPLARHRCEPVGFFALRCFWPEVEVRAGGGEGSQGK